METLRSLQIFILGKEQINLLISTSIVINIIDLVFSLTGKLQTLFLTAPESIYAVWNGFKQTEKVAFLPCCNIVFFLPTASMFTLKKEAEEAMEDGGAEKEDDFQTDEDEDEDENEEMEVDKQVQQKRKKVCRGLK